jgi:hypothetical protein
MSELKVRIDADQLKIKDLEVLESGRGLYGLIQRVVVGCTVDGQAINVGELPMPRLREVGAAIAEAVKGLADPNA